MGFLLLVDSSFLFDRVLLLCVVPSVGSWGGGAVGTGEGSLFGRGDFPSRALVRAVAWRFLSVPSREPIIYGVAEAVARSVVSSGPVV